MASSRETRRGWLAWATVCLVWGTTYFAIKVALETIPPFLIGGLRYTFAGAVLAASLVGRGERLPAARSWPGFALLGFLMFGLGNGGVLWAEVWIASGLAAVIIATTPFWMVGVEAFVPGGERLTWRHMAGLGLGFVGIVLLVGPSMADEGGWRTLAGVIALQVACAGWAVGSAYGRRHAMRVSPGMSAAMQMAFGGLVMLLAGTLLGEWRTLRFIPASFAALSYLALAGSLLAFVAYIYALRHLPVSLVALYAYVNPVIAVALGTWLLGEPFGLRMFAAVAVILSGLVVVSTARSHDVTARPVTRPAAERPARRREASGVL